MTILDYFLLWEKKTPNCTFLKQPDGASWKNYSWNETGAKARQLLGALQASGYKKGDRISVLSANCAEWIICDITLMMGGYISVPLYANVNSNSLEKILKDADCRALIIGKLASKDWAKQKSVIADSIKLISMDGYHFDKAITWKDFCQESSDNPTMENVMLNDVMTIIYTSGTTGDPKGVVHTYGSIINAVKEASNEVRLNRKGNRFVSYLPLSHAAERGLIECGGIFCGGSISFVESISSFSTNIQNIQPTHFFGVPRIWEKFQAKILEKIPQKRFDLFLKIPILKQLIIRKIKKSLGLQKADVILSGAAPLAPDVIRWFQKLNIEIREAYGMSENFNVISMNPRHAIRIGTVGTLFQNQEVYIDEKSREIMQKCNWLMQGYYKKPDMTKKTIVDGFLHTGDMGYLSNDGYLKITGRVKDIFKTSKGEYISPSPLELPFLDLKIVDQACVMGSAYPQPFVLIVLSDIGNSVSQKNIETELLKIMDKLNQKSMEYQRLKKVIIVKEQWTIENGLLTPTLKIKRNELSRKYEHRFAEFYNAKNRISWEINARQE